MAVLRVGHPDVGRFAVAKRRGGASELQHRGSGHGCLHRSDAQRGRVSAVQPSCGRHSEVVEETAHSLVAQVRLLGTFPG